MPLRSAREILLKNGVRPSPDRIRAIEQAQREAIEACERASSTADPIENRKRILALLPQSPPEQEEVKPCPRAPDPFNYCPDCDGSFPCQLRKAQSHV